MSKRDLLLNLPNDWLQSGVVRADTKIQVTPPPYFHDFILKSLGDDIRRIFPEYFANNPHPTEELFAEMCEEIGSQRNDLLLTVESRSSAVRVV
jgi:hypothetical protein